MWLLAAIVLLPIIEIALFIEVGGLIGLWPTLAIVIAAALAGSALMRRQGAAAIDGLRGPLPDAPDPAPVAHGALVFLAGLLLLVPGFFTDACGLLLLIPAVRRVALRRLRGRVAVRGFGYRTGAQTSGQTGGQPFGADGRPRPARPEVIEGEWEEVPPGKRPTHQPSNWTRH